MKHARESARVSDINSLILLATGPLKVLLLTLFVFSFLWPSHPSYFLPCCAASWLPWLAASFTSSTPQTPQASNRGSITLGFWPSLPRPPLGLASLTWLVSKPAKSNWLTLVWLNFQEAHTGQVTGSLVEPIGMNKF